MKSQLFVAILLATIILATGCASTGYVANKPNVTPEQAQAPAPDLPTAVINHNCQTNADCGTEQTCLNNTCIKIKFVK